MCSAKNMFQSTHPMRGATVLGDELSALIAVSIHAPHAGRDPALKVGTRRAVVAVSIHAPHAGCGDDDAAVLGVPTGFNPRTPCGVRPLEPVPAGDAREVSIHAPHAGCDNTPSIVATTASSFNPRIPCGVRRGHRGALCVRLGGFQSTHPMRGATHPPRLLRLPQPVSIHAPHAGCDTGNAAVQGRGSWFQSTHPMRGATRSAWRSSRIRRRFNPRTPCGVRPRRGS